MIASAFFAVSQLTGGRRRHNMLYGVADDVELANFSLFPSADLLGAAAAAAAAVAAAETSSS